MDIEALATQVAVDPNALEHAPHWPADVARAVVDHLKSEADRHWGVNAHRSLALADTIVTIGHARGDAAMIALGTMARGDALKFLGRITDAWQTLDEAGQQFERIGDEVGWARTRLGQLSMCVALNRVNDALRDAERVRTIFVAHGEHERVLRLNNDTGYVYMLLGDHYRSLEHYRTALAIATALGADGEKYLGTLHTNIGLAHEALGDLKQALIDHTQARECFERTAQARYLAIAETNIALISMAQGEYRRALRLLHRAARLYAAEHLERDALETNRLLADCYIMLNRHAEARDLLHDVIAAYRASGTEYEAALGYVQLATAEAELGRLDAAQAALDVAEPIFRAVGAANWEATTRLRRGRIALQQGATGDAEREAEGAAACFKAARLQPSYAQALLLQGQAALAQGNTASAARAGRAALGIARRSNVPGLRYTAHLMLGRVAEAGGDALRATRRYHAAAATVERMQRGLTIRLRPGFLEDKGEALRALIALRLQHNQTAHAFAALERAKSQVLLGYLANRDQLRWVADNAHAQALIAELADLRQEHHRLYGIAHGTAQNDGPSPAAIEHARHQLAACERRMRAITDQLHLRGSTLAGQIRTPSLHELQQHTGDGALIEYYNDGTTLWAFVLDRHGLTQHRLPCTVTQIDHLVAQTQVNIAAALQGDPHAASTRALTLLARRILQRLHALLIAPLGAQLHDRQRLHIVPYGALHYLPFHLLHDGAAYLIQTHEVVILPAAGLLPQRGPRRAPGALILAHSSSGHVPQTLVEAEVVQHLLGGHVLREHEAQRTALDAPPRQVLHIAAHGEQRLDQPDLSYLDLADGQAYADDLWQHDLSYELVTLSACETGRARVAAGDELIGLGQSLLYAGAGAVISSLWRVRDDAVVSVMERLYAALTKGESKAAALQHAQSSVLADMPHLHPAFWGAFQLVGDAAPLHAPL